MMSLKASPIRIFLFAMLALSVYFETVSAQCKPEQLFNLQYAKSCAGCEKKCISVCSDVGSGIITLVCSGASPPFLPDRSHECMCCCAPKPPVPVPSPPAAPSNICRTGQIYSEIVMPGDNDCSVCTSGCRSECSKLKTRLAKVSCRKEDLSSLLCECCCRSSTPSIMDSVMDALGY
ncbi:hypothetical protein C5167_027690 [Papaver somniferum]|uniref:uncharacterized protein LOC113339399 n=1 Tax=Papaver somniferum TaxID=3469 RepID=UPI000E705789|nr:uncharacterized protein LOC113339399 [Papaver somniferum]RZC91622.1 hypothetical protein C5167_027690 [Papaver somniferum]